MNSIISRGNQNDVLTNVFSYHVTPSKSQRQSLTCDTSSLAANLRDNPSLVIPYLKALTKQFPKAPFEAKFDELVLRLKIKIMFIVFLRYICKLLVCIQSEILELFHLGVVLSIQVPFLKYQILRNPPVGNREETGWG